MRPSSSPSDPGPPLSDPGLPSDPGLLGGVLGRGGAAHEVSDVAWVRAMLDVEAALATACQRAGLVAAAEADAVRAACAEPVDPGLLGREAAASGNPVVPLVRVLEERGARAVHLGATSQDVLDSAMVLVAVRAGRHVVADLRGAADAAAALALEHAATPVAGRTLLQQALPTTFGLKAAGWALSLDRAAAVVEQRTAALPVQLGGAVGTLALYGDAGLAVLGGLAGELGLAVPDLPWHTAREPLTDLAGGLGLACGVVGKAALDVCLLAQTEVGEVREATPGGSSTMPHKRNPVAAVGARAAAARAPGLVATLLTCAAQEHERAAGAWHAEWEALSALLRATGSAAAALRESLQGLVVRPERMAANLRLHGDAHGAEAVAHALTAALGRTPAQALVATAVARAESGGTSLRDALLADPGCPLTPAQLDDLLRPSTRLATALVARALQTRSPQTRSPQPGGPA